MYPPLSKKWGGDMFPIPPSIYVLDPNNFVLGTPGVETMIYVSVLRDGSRNPGTEGPKSLQMKVLRTVKKKNLWQFLS